MFKSKIVEIITINNGRDNEIIDDTVCDLCKELSIHIDDADIKLAPIVYNNNVYCLVSVHGYPTDNIAVESEIDYQQTTLGQLKEFPIPKGANYDFSRSY